ncbi:unnamed protein product [[Candida] boidinii]|uniref:Unnamed protein product n=1 Tax=Candida boidinii TaxID=5477 RepID=A0A9W6T3R7_CANBO|nr:unnamed protein product [[Candida] boidinii]
MNSVQSVPAIIRTIGSNMSLFTKRDGNGLEFLKQNQNSQKTGQMSSTILIAILLPICVLTSLIIVTAIFIIIKRRKRKTLKNQSSSYLVDIETSNYIKNSKANAFTKSSVYDNLKNQNDSTRHIDICKMTDINPFNSPSYHTQTGFEIRGDYSVFTNDTSDSGDLISEQNTLPITGQRIRSFGPIHIQKISTPTLALKEFYQRCNSVILENMTSITSLAGTRHKNNNPTGAGHGESKSENFFKPFKILEKHKNSGANISGNEDTNKENNEKQYILPSAKLKVPMLEPPPKVRAI